MRLDILQYNAALYIVTSRLLLLSLTGVTVNAILAKKEITVLANSLIQSLIPVAPPSVS